MNDDPADPTTSERRRAVERWASCLGAPEDEQRRALDEQGLEWDEAVARTDRAIQRALAVVGSRTSAGSDRPAARPVPWLAAAAVLLAAVWAVSTGFDDTPVGDPGGPAVASAERDLTVLRPERAAPDQRRSFRSGDTLVNGPAHESQVTLASGASLALGRCSMLTLRQDERGPLIDPRLGRLSVRASAAGGLRVATPRGIVRLSPGARLEIDRRADGYDLTQSDHFLTLAQEVHMKLALPLIVTSVTLIQGAAHWEGAAPVEPLVVGQTLQDDTAPTDVAAIEAQLLAAVGTWDVTMTRESVSGGSVAEFQGVEVCRAGPGDKWLITDMTMERDGRERTLHTVVGYDARHRSYTGSLVDNFGGEIGLIRGTQGPDLQERVLEMYSARNTPGFDVRWIMTWEGKDRRHTRMEMLMDGEWVLASRMEHRRRRR